MNGFLRKLTSKEGENQNKKKIENLVFLIIILIVTIIIINAIWKKDENSNNTTKDSLITAGGTGALLWAKQIIGRLGVFRPDTLEAWYAYFSTGEAQHFFALMQTLPSAAQ